MQSTRHSWALAAACSLGLIFTSFAAAQTGGTGGAPASGGATAPATGGTTGGATVGGGTAPQAQLGLGAGVNAGGQATGGTATGQNNPFGQTGGANLNNANPNMLNRLPPAQQTGVPNNNNNAAVRNNAAGTTPNVNTNATGAGSLRTGINGNSGQTTGVPGATQAFGTTSSGAATLNGSTTASSSASASSPFNLQQQFNVSFSVGGSGLRVGNVGAGIGQQAGLLAGDQVVSINGTAVNSEAELATLMGQIGSSPLMIGIQRDGQFRMLQAGPIAAGLSGTATGGVTTAVAGGVTTNAAVNTTGLITTGGAGTQIPQSVALTGNFSTDFDRWGTDFSTALTVQQTQFQNQIDQLTQLNDRVNALRTGMLSSTGQSADNVHMLEQLRRLRNDVTMLGAQSSGEFQTQINALRDRLNQLQPVGTTGTTTSAGVTAGERGNSAATAGERGNSAATAGEAAAPRTTTPR